MTDTFTPCCKRLDEPVGEPGCDCECHTGSMHGMTTQQVKTIVGDAATRAAEADAIVRELARVDRMGLLGDDSGPVCQICLESIHRDDCLFLRCRRYVSK